MSKAKAKQEFKRKMKQAEPVFRLKLETTSSCICKYIGSIEKREELCDESIELDTKTGYLQLPNIGKYEIVGKAYSCNLPGAYMLKEEKKYPLLYFNLLYVTQLVTGSLFSTYVYITLDEETSKSLLLPKHYVNKTMRGTFTVELTTDDGFLTFAVNKRKPIIEKEVMLKYAEKLNELTEEEQDNLETMINSEIEKELDKLRNWFEPIPLFTEKFSATSKKKILKKIEDMYSSKEFSEMIDLCLQFKDYERMQKMGSDRPFKLPKKVVNLKDFENNLDKIDEYIDNLTSESDESENEEEK